MTLPHPPIAFRAGLLPWSMALAMPWRVELASSAHDAPLYLSAEGDRIRWTPDPDEALTCATRDAAFDRVVAEALADVVRLTR